MLHNTAHILCANELRISAQSARDQLIVVVVQLTHS